MQSQSRIRTGKVHRLGNCERGDQAASLVRVVVLDSAKEHLIEGFSFYETRNSGLGTYFLNSLFADIDSLTIYAGIHLFFNGYQRMHSQRFPFSIYYLIQKEEVRVYAVLDARRRPSFIKRTLKQI